MHSSQTFPAVCVNNTFVYFLRGLACDNRLIVASDQLLDLGRICSVAA